jgi:hypothetical protein
MKLQARLAARWVESAWIHMYSTDWETTLLTKGYDELNVNWKWKEALMNSMQGQVGQRILANAFELGRYVTVIVKRGGKALDRATVTCSDYQNPDCVLDKKYHQGRYRLSDAAPTYYE